MHNFFADIILKNPINNTDYTWKKFREFESTIRYDVPAWNNLITDSFLNTMNNSQQTIASVHL